jgi:hypothetical protein
MHLKTEIALDLLEQRLDKNQELLWNQHLQGCNTCAKEIGRWRELRYGLKRSSLRNAPAEDMQNAVHLFRSPPEAGRSKLRRILASVVFDSFLQPALAGARGGIASRQLVLKSEMFDIHVKVWGSQNQRQLIGQLLAPTGENLGQEAQCHLLLNGKRLETKTMDDQGEFHFTNVPDGNLSLEIDLPSLTIFGTLDNGKML